MDAGCRRGEWRMNEMTHMARWFRRAGREEGTLRSPADMVTSGLVPAERLAALEAVAARYAVAITPHIAGLIGPRDPSDPIARQFVPDAAELMTAPEDLAD